MDAGQIEVGRLVFATAGDDDFGFGRLAEKGLNNRLHRNQFKIHAGIEFIEDDSFIEPTGDGGSGNFPCALCFDVIDRLLLTSPDDGIPAGAKMINKVGIAFS